MLFNFIRGFSLHSTGNTYSSITVAYNIQGERKMEKTNKRKHFVHFRSAKIAKTGNQRVTSFPPNHNEASFTTEQGTKALTIFPE